MLLFFEVSVSKVDEVRVTAVVGKGAVKFYPIGISGCFNGFKPFFSSLRKRSAKRREVYAVSGPDRCIDEYVYEEALRRDCDGKEALLGYDAISVFPALHRDISPRVSILAIRSCGVYEAKGALGDA